MAVGAVDVEAELAKLDGGGWRSLRLATTVPALDPVLAACLLV